MDLTRVGDWPDEKGRELSVFAKECSKMMGQTG